MPEGQQDDRLQHQYQQLLESPVTTVNATDTVNAVDTLRNENGLPNELNAPFTDLDLQAL